MQEGGEKLMQRFANLPGGLRLAYAEQGPADGTPIVFLHGVTDSWRAFGPLLHQLPRDVRACALSQRGHGESSRPASGYTYGDMAGDLRAFLDSRGIARAVVAGHSMGAMVAQRFAVDHGDRVAGLVLMGAFASLHAHAGMSAFVASTIAPLADPIGSAFARDWQLSTLARDVDAAFLDTVVEETLKVPARVWHEAFTGFLTTPDCLAELGRTAPPTLLMWGDRDAYAVRADQDALLAAIPGAQLVVYEGGGHAFHWEDPARAAADIMAFAERVSLPSPSFAP
jgi:pimeloyl-ACP methyl ester carboxylesterase